MNNFWNSWRDLSNTPESSAQRASLLESSLTLTDGGNAVIDCHFPEVDDPERLDQRLQCLSGVLDTGLFIGLCDTLIVGTPEGIEVIESGVPRQS